MILLLDAAKAVDSSEWAYLWEILAHCGLGDGFIKWVILLYSVPVARLRINGDLTDTFPLHRGTQQECPLSPLLFALAIEPLAAAIRPSLHIVWFRHGSGEDNVSIYANYTFLYLGEMGASLSHIMSLIARFSALPGFSINRSKSVILPLDVSSQPLPASAHALKIVRSFRYLAVQITVDPMEYLHFHLHPLPKQF